MIRYINYIITLYIFKQILLYNVTLFKSICTSARAEEQMLLQLNYLFHLFFSVLVLLIGKFENYYEIN